MRWVNYLGGQHWRHLTTKCFEHSAVLEEKKAYKKKSPKYWKYICVICMYQEQWSHIWRKCADTYSANGNILMRSYPIHRLHYTKWWKETTTWKQCGIALPTWFEEGTCLQQVTSVNQPSPQTVLQLVKCKCKMTVLLWSAHAESISYRVRTCTRACDTRCIGKQNEGFDAMDRCYH